MRMSSSSRIVVALVLGFTLGQASIDLVPERVSLDVLSWSNCLWQNRESQGFTLQDVYIYQRAAYLWLDGRIVDWASLRLGIDGIALEPDEMCLDCRWDNGLTLKVGQFRLPLGFESETELGGSWFVDNSLVRPYWKPSGPLDVGVMLGYDYRALELRISLVNGNGPNTALGSDNRWKDLAGRAAVTVLREPNLVLAGRGYHGRVGPDGTEYDNIAVEAMLRRGSLVTVAEFQHSYWVRPRNSFYLLAAYRYRFLEPAARVSMAFHWDDKYELQVTGGVNLHSLGDKVRLMLSYDYWRKATDKPEARGSRGRVSFQLQATI